MVGKIYFWYKKRFIQLTLLSDTESQAVAGDYEQPLAAEILDKEMKEINTCSHTATMRRKNYSFSRYFTHRRWIWRGDSSNRWVVLTPILWQRYSYIYSQLAERENTRVFKRRDEAWKESAHFALCCPGRRKGTTHVVDLSKRTKQHINWENIKTTGNYIYEHKYWRK